jgi:hypothetical protein
MNHTETAAVQAFPQLQRLIELKCGGWIFQPIAVDGDVVMLGGWRVLGDGWTEAMVIRDLGDAKAYRCNPVGDEVWKHEGGLVDTIDRLIELPAPGEAGAPTLAIGRHPTLWTPG